MSEQQVFYRPEHFPMLEIRQARATSVAYHRHSHEEFSIGVVDSGNTDYFIDGQTRRIGPGAVVLMNPDQVHSCNPLHLQSWSYRMLYLQADWLTALQAEVLERSPDSGFQALSQSLLCGDSHYQQYHQLCSLLTSPDSRLGAEVNLTDYFAELIRADQRCEAPDRLKCASHLQRAYEFIADECVREICLDDVAAVAGLSRYRLVHAFRQHYGITPHALQITRRISHARQLLKTGNSIAAVAADTGFTDQSHFHRHFKRQVAVTPRQYQLSAGYR